MVHNSFRRIIGWPMRINYCRSGGSRRAVRRFLSGLWHPKLGSVPVGQLDDPVFQMFHPEYTFAPGRTRRMHNFPDGLDSFAGSVSVYARSGFLPQFRNHLFHGYGWCSFWVCFDRPDMECGELRFSGFFCLILSIQSSNCIQKHMIDV